ncbi:MAG: hypothetical protein ACRD4R_02750 [Candidatus Acidiferrales bacterium]
MSSAVQLDNSNVGFAESSQFELTPPPATAPSHDEFIIAEMERRFGGHAVWKPKAQEIAVDPEMYAPSQVEPEWDRYGFRGQVGKLLWQRGLRKKAVRFVSCNKCARSGLCSRYPDEHKYFIPNGCEVVFCKDCADEVRRALLLDYRSVILSAITKLNAIPQGWVLARVNFTLRSDGTEITPDRVKKFNACVRAVMRAAVGSRKGYGMLFVDEVGFEKRGHLPDFQRIARGLNLHCHGLYLGPRVDWEQTRDLWIAETEKKFGVASRGFYIQAVRGFAENPERAIRWALNHMLKYVSKPPAVTPERLASLISAFNGARRVHSLGLFYGEKPTHKKGDCPCPKCKAMGIVSAVGFEGRSLPNGGCIPRLEPIESLVARGYVPLREAGREAVLSIGVSREKSWGASP